MSDRPTTRERILEASLRLFNQRGYAATSIAEIAACVGIAKGNLTYHFPSKFDLVLEFAGQAREQRRANSMKPRNGPLADEYVEIVHAAMEQSRVFRFLVRDQAQFREKSKARRPNPIVAVEIDRLRELLERMQKEGMLRQNPGLDLLVLARSVWMVSRFWMDHLDLDEGVDEVTWADQERGMRQHFAVLMPCLTAPARRQFEAALVRLAAHHAKLESKLGDSKR
jgi:AcrR family transcriptional regulator